jgi:FkbM family methyltransferase
MASLVEDILQADAAENHAAVHDLASRNAAASDQVLLTIYNLLVNQRFKSAYIAAKALGQVATGNPVSALALSLGGLLFGAANDEVVGRTALGITLDHLSPEQQQSIYAGILSKAIPNLVNHAFVHDDSDALMRLLEILKAGTPQLRGIFQFSETVPPLDLEKMKRAHPGRDKMVTFPGLPPGTPKQPRRGVVAVRKYFLGAADPAISRLCDLGPRFAAAMNAYGWPTQFFGMSFLDPRTDYGGIAEMCRQTQAEILVLDDNIIQSEVYKPFRNDMLTQLRRDLPGLKIVSVYFDPWMLPEAEIVEASAIADVVWAPFPSVPAWKHPSLADKIFMAQFPLGLDFKPGAAPLRPRMTFAGGVMGYNWHRALWLGAAERHGLAVDRQVSSHKPDGLPALPSYETYLRRLADATCSINFSMRSDMQSIITGRSFETIFSGALLIEEWSKDIDHYFIAGEHYLRFSTFSELASVAQFLAAKPDEAEAIRKAGTAFAYAQYSDPQFLGDLDRRLYHGGKTLQPAAVSAAAFATPSDSFKAHTGAEVRVKVVDIGANPVGGPAPYESLLRAGEADVIGFEPNPQALAELNKIKGPHEIYLPHAIGDGKRHTLNFCLADGMTSLLAPNPQVLNLFHGFPEWGRIVATEPIDTMRLDDVPETEGVDLLKMDIQGAELMVLQHAEERLRDALVIQTEVEFLPMYVDQPLFSDVDMFLRERGFVFHRFFPEVSRVIRPLVVGNNIYAGLSQLVWADAIFVRDFTKLEKLDDRQLLAIAAIVQECYNSIDLTLHLLNEYDRRNKTQYGRTFLERQSAAQK